MGTTARSGFELPQVDLALSHSNHGSGSPSSANSRRSYSARRPSASSSTFFLT